MIMQVVGATTSCIINRPEKKLTYSLFTIKILDLKEPCKNNWKEKSGILRKASLSKVVELSNLGYNFTIYLRHQTGCLCLPFK